VKRISPLILVFALFLSRGLFLGSSLVLLRRLFLVGGLNGRRAECHNGENARSDDETHYETHDFALPRETDDRPTLPTRLP
jgi:hypothetical protein